MAGSGSENRQREEILRMRCTKEEAALIREQAKRAGVSVGSLMRYATLGLPPVRAGRQPTIDEKIGAQLVAKLGLVASLLRERNGAVGPVKIDPHIEAACRDIADMHAVVFQALRREP